MRKHTFGKKILTFAMALSVAVSTVLATAPAATFAATATESASRDAVVLSLANGVGNKTSVRKGATRTLAISNGTFNLKNSELKFVSSNTKVATVTSAGVIKGVGAGTATITVTAKANSKLTTKVTVVVPSTVVKSIKLNYTKWGFDGPGRTVQLKATTNPTTATVKDVIWKTSNSKVAVVDKTGRVKSVGTGTATITAVSLDGSCKATCSVVVRGVKVINATSTSVIARPLQSYYLKVTNGLNDIIRNNADYTFKVGNGNVAKVYADGTVRGVAAGTTTLTITSKANSKAVANYKIVVPSVEVTGVTLNKTAVTLDGAGKTFALKGTIAPNNATVKDIRWNTDNAKVAKVSADGVITAVGTGTTKITATTYDGAKKAYCTVTVTGIGFGNAINNETSVRVGSTRTLSINNGITDTVLKNSGFTFKSADTKIVTVDANGTLKGIKAGTTTVTVTSKTNAKVTATLKVVVPSVKVTKVTLNKTTATLTKIGSTLTLTATIAPTNATEKGIIWVSTNTAVATVSNTGVVTAVGSGVAKIKAVALDFGIQTYCTVTVNVPVTVASQSMYANEINKVTNFDAKAKYTDTKNILTVDSKGNITVNSYVDGKVSTTLKATSADGLVNSTVAITVIGTTNAVTKTDEGGYKFVLDKNAESFDAQYKDLAYAILPEMVGTDIEAFLAKVDNIIDSKAPAKTLFNAITEENAYESDIVASNAKVTVDTVDNVKVITVSSQGKTRTAKVTLVSNTSLKIEARNKTVVVSEIAVVKNDANELVVTAHISGSDKDINVKLTAKKDGSSIVLTDMDSNNAVIAKYTETEDTYEAIVGATYYGKIINLFDIEDKLSEEAVNPATIVNNYNVVI